MTKARIVRRLAILATQTPVRDGATLLITEFLRYAAVRLASTSVLRGFYARGEASIAVTVRVFVDHHFAGERAINVGEVSRG